MDFDDLLEIVTRDSRSKSIPVLHIVQILVIVEEALERKRHEQNNGTSNDDDTKEQPTSGADSKGY